MITDAQIEAAAEAAWNHFQADTCAYFPNAKRLTWAELCQLADQPNSGRHLVENRDYCRRIARAALEAGEAAAWSRDLSAAPPRAPLLVFRGTSLDTGAVLENRSTGERAWWSGDCRVAPEDIRMWRHVPTPPTEGNR